MTAEANLLPCESLHVAAAEAPQPHRDAGQFCSHGRQSITCPHALLACDTVRPGVVFSSIPAASHGQPRGRPAPPSSTGFRAEAAEDPNVALLHLQRWVSQEVPASRGVAQHPMQLCCVFATAGRAGTAAGEGIRPFKHEEILFD